MTADTSLQEAAALGDLERVAAALAAGAPVDDLDPLLGLSALMLAARGGHLQVLDALIEHDAKLEQTGRGGLTALMLAAMSDQPHAVARLLDDGADTAAVADAGGRAIHLAAAVGALRSLRVLEERGAALFAPDAHGLSIAAYAEQRRQEATLSFIAGARLRQQHREMQRMRTDPRITAGILGPSPDGRARAAAEAREEAALAEPATLYSAVPPQPLPRADQMRRISAALGPLSESAFEEALLDHLDFLRSGGAAWPGRWHSFSDEGVVFAISDGPPGQAGHRADLHLRDLSRVDASRAVLRRAHLIGIQADGISFLRADLSRATITDSDLRGACLEGAALVRADLSRANLHRASLLGADLRMADLEGADLRGADLRGATLAGANLRGADLRGVIR